MENNPKPYLPWIFVIVVLLLNGGLFIYWDSLPATGSIFSATIANFPLALISGIILGIYPLYKFSKKAMLSIVLSFVFIMFISFIIGGAIFATKALNNPGLYLGFSNTSIPEYGIWHELYEARTYEDVSIIGFLVTIGIFLGLGLRWIYNKIFSKKVSIDAKIV